MRLTIWSGSFLIGICLLISACNQNKLPVEWNYGIIPKVQKIDTIQGGLELGEDWSINTTVNGAYSELAGFLMSKFGLKLRRSSNSSNIINLRLDTTLTLGHEAYVLKIEESKVDLSSPTKEGLARGLASLKQLILLNTQAGKVYLPYLAIKDFASFSHRGLLLDCCRHFFEVDVVKKYIDLLSLYKMNTLHWHLTEDQAWRIAIDKYPRLTEVGAYRTEIDGSKYGGYYSKEDIKEIVAYAAQKEITIIPEIELPGHSQAAIASYPHLSCTGDQIDVANDWGVFKDIYCAGNDSVFLFLEDVLIEVMELFPSKKIHIGGDEAPKVRWEECTKCQRRIKEEGLKDEHELQSYFIRRIQSFLKEHERELIGWDEILEGGLAKGAIVQSWRGMKGGIEAAAHGNQAIMSPTSHAYLDYGLDAIDLEKVYNFNPIPPELEAQKRVLILGGECNMWTEHVPDEKTLDSKVFPRMLAMAEALWSDSLQRDFEEFRGRLWHNYKVLRRLEVDYGMESVPMDHEILLEKGSAKVNLIPSDKDIKLKYKQSTNTGQTSSGSFTVPIRIKGNDTISVQPYRYNRTYGDSIYLYFDRHQAIDANVTYTRSYSDYYEAGGNNGLVDSRLGSLNFRDGAWQGFWGDDLECTIELSTAIKISELSANFLQYNNAWIFIPTMMEVDVSVDGEEWQPLGSATSTVDPTTRGKFIETLTINEESKSPVSYLRIKVSNLGKVPDWHEAAGSDAWIFIDEIRVK